VTGIVLKKAAPYTLFRIEDGLKGRWFTYDEINKQGPIIIQHDSDIDKRSREALEWLVALREEDNDESVLTRFLAWKTASAENAQAWDDAQRLWNVLGAVQPALDAPASEDGSHSSAAVARPAFPAHSPRRVWQLRRPVLAAALAGALAVITILVAPTAGLWLRADYQTGTGQSQQVRLEDGSIVTLGADSAVSLSFAQGRRDVRLLAGEAYFEVAHDPSRPFTVDAQGVETTVLGTGFNIRMNSDGVAVSVAHGRVLVDCPPCGNGKAGPPLEAGEWQRVDWKGTIERGTTSTSAVGGWRNGTLMVEDVAVGDVIDALNRYYRGRIIVAAPGLRDKRVTGVYDLADPITALRAVAQSQGANIYTAGSWLAVVSAR